MAAFCWRAGQVLGLLAVLAAASLQLAAGQKPPNFLFILTDDQGASY